MAKVLAGLVAAIVFVGVIFLVLRFSTPEDTWLCQNGAWVKHGNPSAAMPTTGCELRATSTEQNNVGMANPASVNCDEKGGNLEIKKDANGGEYGMCIFPDGKQCEEWAMFRGECPVGGETPRETSIMSPTLKEPILGSLTINGTMPGSWYFEATARVEIYDANGKQVAIAPAQAKGEWMTTNSVPFEAVLKFDAPETATGTLVLKNDNPSDLRENDKSEIYPIVFGQTVSVFFNNTVKDPNMLDCSKVYAVERIITSTPAVGRAAIEELLKGPTESEKSAGYLSNINMGVGIQSLTIENNVAKVDFDKKIEEALGGSCRVGAIRAQIEETLKQFSTVKSVIISVDGRTEDILQP
ncbi:MAG: DUF333 domain-containing protein [Candidatus Magasanikbacteria bacterium]|nr:DUF333 domain-containing protein [Candidatus Magasanikbacteria bacterium]